MKKTHYTSTGIKKTSKKRVILLVVIAIVVLTLATLAILEKTNKINLFDKKQGPKNPVAQGEINLEPPTDEEKKAGDEQKEAIVKEQQQPSNPSQPVPTPTSGKKSVKPTITRTGGGEVSGFVPGIVENGGICTATFTKSGSAAVTKTSSAFANASNTTCSPVSYAGSGVGPGWRVTLAYSSSTSEGVSDAADVQ